MKKEGFVLIEAGTDWKILFNYFLANPAQLWMHTFKI